MTTTRPDPDPLYTEPTDSERRVMDTWRRAIADEDDGNVGGWLIISVVVVLVVAVIVAALLLLLGRDGVLV